jgi:enoyl-[acyl-carrier protein] reductase I
MFLKDKNILIMGVRNKWSIAWGAVQSAVEQGANIIYTATNSEDLEKVKELMKEIPNSKGYICDVGTDESIENLFNDIKKDYDHLDGILHSIAHANTEELHNDFILTSREGFAHANDISAYSLIAICRYAKDLLAEGAGIVTFTYHGSTQTFKNYNVMGTAKAALECNVRYLATELGKNKVRVNAISAGPIKTLSAKGIKDFGSIQSVVEEKAPLHENITIKQVGDVNAFLMSDLASGITGQIVYVDNGFSIVGV